MIKELVKKIELANEVYRIGKPMMSDSQYDILIDELKSKNIQFPETVQGIDNLRLALSNNEEATKYLFNKFKDICIG